MRYPNFYLVDLVGFLLDYRKSKLAVVLFYKTTWIQAFDLEVTYLMGGRKNSAFPPQSRRSETIRSLGVSDFFRASKTILIVPHPHLTSLLR